MSTGVLLINVGTVDAPTPEAVGRYLRQFLMDPFVIDIPAPLRWFLVNLMIVPRRKYRSAEAYQKIQTPEGPPLLVHTRALADRLAAKLAQGDSNYVVEYGMRYGNPSIKSALETLAAKEVSRIHVMPLYPQYAGSSFETAIVETRLRAKELGCEKLLTFLPPFFDEPGFINACADGIRQATHDQPPEHFVFSFHGVPVRHLKRLHEKDNRCLSSRDCCAEITSTNANCYRAQCFATARAIAKELDLRTSDYTVCFQSRLGRAEWIGPNTVSVLQEIANRGVKRIAVACPSFVADCLETIEEIGLRGRKTFVEAGGQEFTLVPSLNSSASWVNALSNQLRKA